MSGLHLTHSLVGIDLCCDTLTRAISHNAAENIMAVELSTASIVRHESGKEGTLEEEIGKDGNTSIDTERRQSGENRSRTDKESTEIGDRSDSDRHSSMTESLSHTGGHRDRRHDRAIRLSLKGVSKVCILKGIHKDKHIINTNTQNKERKNTVNRPIEEAEVRRNSNGENNSQTNTDDTTESQSDL